MCVPHENNEAAVPAVNQTRPVRLKTYFSDVHAEPVGRRAAGEDEAVDKQRETLKDGARIHERPAPTGLPKRPCPASGCRRI